MHKRISKFTNLTIGESTQVMKRTHDEYKGELGSALKTAQQSLTKLFRRDMTDRILLFLSVSVFIAVVLYILKARLYG
jgi:hypothetical protein